MGGSLRLADGDGTGACFLLSLAAAEHEGTGGPSRGPRGAAVR